MTTVTATGSVPESSARVWWLVERSTSQLDAFRIIVGALLVAHFVEAYRVLPSVLEAYPLAEAMRLSAGQPVNLYGHGFDFQAFAVSRLGLGIAIALALLIALGTFVRPAAAVLLLLSRASIQALAPVVQLEDLIVNQVLFWVMLLPLGGAGISSAGLGVVRRPAAPVSAVVVALFLCEVLLLHLAASALRPFVPTPTAPLLWTSLLLLPACQVAPYASARMLALGLQVALHAALAVQDRLFVGHGLLAATAVLLFGEIATGAQIEKSKRPPLIGVPAAIGCIHLALVALFFAAGLVGAGRFQAAANRVLIDVGTPLFATGQVAAASDVRVYVAGARDKVLREYPHDDLRSRMLLSYLVEAETTRERDLGSSLGRTLAARYCDETAPPNAIAGLYLESAGARRQISQFMCGERGELPRDLDAVIADPRKL